MTLVDFSEIAHLHEPVTSVAIGAFDALHKGHLRLLKKTLSLGGGSSAVVTFKSSPNRVLNRTHYLGELLSWQQRCDLFEKLGFKFLIVIDFSVNFSRMRGEVFLNEIMKLPLLRFVVVGRDFSCGYQGELAVNQMALLLASANISLCKISLKRVGFRKISSTQIRQSLLRGQLRAVRSQTGRPVELMLPDSWVGRPYIQDGVIIPRSSFQQLLPLRGSFRFSQSDGVCGMIRFTHETVRLQAMGGAAAKTLILINMVKEKQNGTHIGKERGNRSRIRHKR